MKFHRPTGPVVPADFEGLRDITWNRDPTRPIPAREVFALYERNWHRLDPGSLSTDERELVRSLADEFGDGAMLI